MKLIYVCSPLRGDIEGNVKRAREYCKSVIQAGHIPIAPHVAYQGILNDDIPAERKMALKIGRKILKKCDEVWVFGHFISEGMRSEIEAAQRLQIPVYYRGK